MRKTFVCLSAVLSLFAVHQLATPSSPVAASAPAASISAPSKVTPLDWPWG